MQDFVERLGSGVVTLEERFDRIRSALEAYKALEEETVTAEEPELIPPEGSLFDNLLRRALEGHVLNLASDSTDADSFAIILENSNDPALLVDEGGAILRANPALVSLFGYSMQEIEGRNVLEFVPKVYHAALRERFLGVLGYGRARNDDNLAVFRTRRKGGEPVSVECLLAQYRRDERREIAIIMRDIARSHEIAAKLSASVEQFETLSETIAEAILRIDENFTIIFANSAVLPIFGYERGELLGTNFRRLFPPEIFQRHEEEFRKYFYIDDPHRKQLGLKRTMEILGSHKHRGVSPMEMSFGNGSFSDGRSLTCIIRDISIRKNTERRLKHLAYHDKLTGLGNRDLFQQELSKAFADHPGPDTWGALLFLDLDGFKQVNDTMGHDAGDELLVETARRLRSILRESDAIYRFGGDEFVVLISHSPDARGAALVAQKLLDSVAEPVKLHTQENRDEVSTIRVGVSIGIALIPDHGSDLNRLTKSADLAMYHAKEAGKNCFRFFDAKMDARISRRLQLEQGIRRSLDAGGFCLFYQPLVDRNGEIRELEALIRWEDAELGWMNPGSFIPLAEETNLIIPLGNWIIETACRQLRSWHDAGLKPLSIAINLSANQFAHPEIVAILGNAIRRSGADPAFIRLEITETCVMRDPGQTAEKMRILKEQNPGLEFVIDDFGTGYSSLSYLSKLPADRIKIDLSFVSRLFEEQNQKIVNAIISMADSLEMDYVAEGVENKEQAEFFIQRGCNLMQGFYFHRPLPTDRINALLDSPPDEIRLLS